MYPLTRTVIVTTTHNDTTATNVCDYRDKMMKKRRQHHATKTTEFPTLDYSSSSDSSDQEEEEEEFLSNEMTIATTSTPHCPQHTMTTTKKSQKQIHRRRPPLATIDSSSSISIPPAVAAAASSSTSSTSSSTSSNSSSNYYDALQRQRRKCSLDEIDRRISLRMKNRMRNRMLMSAKADSSSTIATATSSIFSNDDHGPLTVTPLASPPPSKNVTFSTVEYREYRITLGTDSNNNTVRYPMTLDWEYVPSKVIHMNDGKNANKIRRKRNNKLLQPLSIESRQRRLMSVTGLNRKALLALERRRTGQSAAEYHKYERKCFINKVYKTLEEDKDATTTPVIRPPTTRMLQYTRCFYNDNGLFESASQYYDTKQ